MDAIEAVVELAKERDELADELETYESWFESLVGREVTLSIKTGKKKRFVDCVVAEFTPGEGWVLQANDDDEVHCVTFEDFAAGRIWLNCGHPQVEDNDLRCLINNKH